jgi:hypothetical protein
MLPINYDKKCVFIHVPKTAGSYIESMLIKKYDFASWGKLIRYDFDEIKFGPNFFINRTNINNTGYRMSNPYSSKKMGNHKYYSTSPLLLKAMNLDEKSWDELFKFSFVRNPYDRFISGYNFIVKDRPGRSILLNDAKYTLEDIEKFNDIEYAIEHRYMFGDISYSHIFVTQTEHMQDRTNKLTIDFIGKTENLEADLETLFKKLGYENTLHKTPNKKYNTYKKYYNQKLLDFVNEFFDEDFKNFGYTKYDTLEDYLNAPESDNEEKKDANINDNEIIVENGSVKDDDSVFDGAINNYDDNDYDDDELKQYMCDNIENNDDNKNNDDESEHLNNFRQNIIQNFTKQHQQIYKLKLGYSLLLFNSSFTADSIEATETNFKNNIISIINSVDENFQNTTLFVPQMFIKSGSYLNNISYELYRKQITDYEIPIIKLNKRLLNLPVVCKNSNFGYEDCMIRIDENKAPIISSNIFSNILTVLSYTNMEYNVFVYLGGVNSFTDKKNTCILFNFAGSYLNSNTINFFTCMFYSVLLTNIDVTEYDVLDLFTEKMGFTVNHYDYLRNDYHHNYSRYNNCLVYDEGDDAKIISYPLKCCRITAQIYFLWSLVQHYASINSAYTVDYSFSIKFFKCMFNNLGGELIVEKINEVFTDLLPLTLNTTLEYWFGKINTSINITNLFILQHAFELLDYDLELLTKNDVNIFKERNINFEYYTQKLNNIFNDIENTYKINSMINHYYSEAPIGVSNMNSDYGIVPLKSLR